MEKTKFLHDAEVSFKDLRKEVENDNENKAMIFIAIDEGMLSGMVVGKRNNLINMLISFLDEDEKLRAGVLSYYKFKKLGGELKEFISALSSIADEE